MTSVSMEEVNEDHACILCLEVFLYPVTLPCKHVFCKQCLYRHIENNGFTCPMCRHRLSNWLRRLNINKLNIVDSGFWSELQKKYPEELEMRKNEGAHESLGENCKHIKIIPKHNFAKPGEIRAEFDVELRRFEQENEQKEKENLKLSEALIKLIEEDERKELELLQKQKKEQLRMDEKLAKSLIENEGDAVVTVSSDNSGCGTNMDKSKSSAKGCSGYETHVETDVTNLTTYTCSEEKINDLISGCDSPVFLGPCISRSRLNTLQPSSLFSTNHDQPTCSTPRTSEGPSASSMPLSSSPIPLDTPSCSKVDIFSKFYGKSRWLPQVVVPQRLVSGTELSVVTNNLSKEVISVLSSNPNIDLSVEDLEESRALQTQLEADRVQALKIQNESASEGKKRKRNISTGVKTEYNLRKKGKMDLRKKVLMDRRKTTLDAMEESRALQTQLEADRVLAIKIHNEWAYEEQKRKRTISLRVKKEYNLRKQG